MAEENNNLIFSNDVLDAVEASSRGRKMKTGPVNVLGHTFANDEERREFFRDELRKKLPELKKIEGFPIAADEDIIALSDPPFYTACPNPWLNDFIAVWEEEKKHLTAEGKRKEEKVVTEPYAADVTGIKNDSVYRAHTYHTKVPHTIVMKYLLHYTQPGDIVFDGFAGTGMTGLACLSCEDPTLEVRERVLSDLPDSDKDNWGKRHGICGDLSPYASMISYNYNTPLDAKLLEKEVNRIQKEMDAEYGWMYKTKHSNGKEGEIKCVIWSDVIHCGNCGKEFTLWDSVVDKEHKVLHDKYTCPYCGHSDVQQSSNTVFEHTYDSFLEESINAIKSVPARIVYEYNGRRYEKAVEEYDLDVLNRIESLDCRLFVPKYRMPEGDETRRNDRVGITHIHQFYTRRNLIALAAFYEKIQQSALPNKVKFIFTGMINRSTKMNRVHFTKYLNGKTDWDAGHLKGTLYIPSFPVESSVLAQISNKLGRYLKAAPMLPTTWDNGLYVGSANDVPIKDNSIDYIFTDPPFGSNIMYSELNFLPESWFRVLTNKGSEAIVNNSQNKDFIFYLEMMTACYKEFYRVLKPGRWMTVEFSNTNAGIWNSIQQALSKAGFVIANVSALNKGQGGMRSITTTTAVKEDLAISCYKPSDKVIELVYNGSVDNVWEFLENHLSYLPVYIINNGKMEYIAERDKRILYDRVISYYVQKGLDVPIDAIAFQKGLRERFEECDGMFFTPIQKNEYLEKKKQSPQFVSLGLIVGNEVDGIEWLRHRLRYNPQTYQDIQPDWLQVIGGLRRGDVLPGLDELLEENFIQESDGEWRLPNIQDDIDKDKLREKALLKEFKVYVEAASKPRARIREVRVEAIRAGFKKCYMDKDFATIVMVGDKIPQNLLTEDDILLQFYDIARTRV